MGILDITVVLIYMAGMLVIGIYAKGKIRTMDDFILGGRRFRVFTLIGTILATMIGTGMTLGAVGDVYLNGAGGTVFPMYLGFGCGLVFFGAVVKRIRATGKRTASEIIASAFGRYARMLSAIIVVFYGVAIVALSIAAMRTVIMYAFGEDMPVPLLAATVIAACVCIAYTATGGFYAVVWTDAVQMVIMLVGIFIIGPVLGLYLAGGAEPVVSAYESGSTITVDNSISVFAGLCKAGGGYAKEILPILLRHLEKCRPKEVPQHAERASVCFTGENAEDFIAVLEKRNAHLTASQQARNKKLLKKLYDLQK